MTDPEQEWARRNAAAVRAALHNAAVRAEIAALLGADGSKVAERRRLEAARRELAALGLLDDDSEDQEW